MGCMGGCGGSGKPARSTAGTNKTYTPSKPKSYSTARPSSQRTGASAFGTPRIRFSGKK